MEATGYKKTGKREAIVEAAIQVFSRKGYHNTRMEEIALVAGAGKGTIYEYFNSKLELFQEILFKGWRVFEENTTVEEIDSMPIRELLQGLISGHLRFFKEHSQLTRVTFWDVESIDQELMAWARRIRTDKEQRVQLLIEAAIARGEVRADLDARVISRLVCAIIPYFAAAEVINNEDIDPHRLAAQLTSALLNGIKK
ncbi:MAG: TetR/AcrR family transcriptional regulator [Syntrophomonadaceae bacterium]